MSRILLTALAVALLSLLSASQAQAWGAYHRGYTYHTPGGGFYHHGSTAAYGPYGEHTADRSYGYSRETGFYHSGYGQSDGYRGSSYHYSAGHGGYGGYYGGYRGGYGGYRDYGGYHRRW